MAAADHWSQHELHRNRPPASYYLSDKGDASFSFVRTVQRVCFREAVKHMARKAKNMAKDKVTDFLQRG